MSHRRTLRAAVAAAVCLPFAACGDSSDQVALPTTPPEETDVVDPPAQLDVWNRDNRVVRSSTIKVQGTATPGALVEVDDESMTAGKDGRWIVEAPLEVGKNEFEISASRDDRQSTSKSLTVTRRRTPAQLEELRLRREAAAQRRAARKAAAEAKKAAAVARPDYDNPSFTQINSMMTDYLSAVINDASTADPSLAVADFENAAATASPACAKELRATASALEDTSGGPDEIRARVLDAAAEAFAECG